MVAVNRYEWRLLAKIGQNLAHRTACVTEQLASCLALASPHETRNR